MTAQEPKNIYSKLTPGKCERAYAFAKDLEAPCDACGVKVGDHLTPIALRGVVAMVNGEYERGIKDAAKYVEGRTWVSEKASAELGAEIRKLLNS